MINQLYELISFGKETAFSDYLASIQEQSIAIYGAGGIGSITSEILLNHNCDIRWFIDDAPEKQGTFVNGIEVISLSGIPVDTNDVILICIPNFITIEQNLRSLGYRNVYHLPLMMNKNGFYQRSLLVQNRQLIERVYTLLSDNLSRATFINILKHRITSDFSLLQSIISNNQYFPDDILTLHEQECFVDGGAYQGETISEFINTVKGNFQYIYGFEPDRHNFSALWQAIQTLDPLKIEIWNAGLHSHLGEACFDCNGNSSSAISEGGTDTIDLVALDDLVNEHKPTYIKLDIEGAEAEALDGMKDLIVKEHPKMAVSVYHKPADLWELPLLLHQFNPDYKIYLRHYMQDLNETVCYAL